LKGVTKTAFKIHLEKKRFSVPSDRERKGSRGEKGKQFENVVGGKTFLPKSLRGHLKKRAGNKHEPMVQKTPWGGGPITAECCLVQGKGPERSCAPK